MIKAFVLGGVAQSSSLVRRPVRVLGPGAPPRRWALAGFGAGAMLAAISFDLVAEADHLDR